MARPSKLTDEQKLQIRKLRDEEGRSYPSLAAQFDVSQNTIIRICRPDYYKAGLKASLKYQEENIKDIYEKRKANYSFYRLTFHNEYDAAVIEVLNAQDNVQNYIRELILNDIQNSEREETGISNQ